MFIPILLCTIFAFVSVNADMRMDLTKCEEKLHTLGLAHRRNLPCPTLLSTIDCVEKAIYKETSLTLVELGSVLEGRPAEVITVAVNVISVIKDLCDTDSDLRKEFDKDAECFFTVIGAKNNRPCANEAGHAIEKYDKVYNTAERDPNEYYRFQQCMAAAYTVACAAMDFKEKCGDRAFNTFRTIAKRTTFFKHGICTEQQMENLTTFVMEHIDVDGQDRELLQLALDLKKRRK